MRSVMLRGSYTPGSIAARSDVRQRIAQEMLAGKLTAEELLNQYCTLLYASSHNYSEVAETLGLDRRTVRARVSQDLLKEILSTLKRH